MTAQGLLGCSLCVLISLVAISTIHNTLCDGVTHMEGDIRVPEIPKMNQVNMFQSEEHSVFQKVIFFIRGKQSPLLLKQFLCVAYVPKVYKIVFQSH